MGFRNYLRKSQDDGHQTERCRNFGGIWRGNVVPTAIPMFSRTPDTLKQLTPRLCMHMTKLGHQRHNGLQLCCCMPCWFSGLCSRHTLPQTLHRVGSDERHWHSRWSHSPMSDSAEVTTIFGLVAANLNFNNASTKLGVGRCSVRSASLKTWEYSLESAFYVMYGRSSNYFRFEGRHLKFRPRTKGTGCRTLFHCVERTWKHGFSCWNHLPVSNTVEVATTSGFVAAILNIWANYYTACCQDCQRHIASANSQLGKPESRSNYVMELLPCVDFCYLTPLPALWQPYWFLTRYCQCLCSFCLDFERPFQNCIIVTMSCS
jgi:hypothetical protein